MTDWKSIDTSKLSAGPELDILAAEAMGWEWFSLGGRHSFLVPPWGHEAREPNALSWTKGEHGPRARIEEHFTEFYQNWRIPAYSTEVLASAQLKAWLQKKEIPYAIKYVPQNNQEIPYAIKYVPQNNQDQPTFEVFRIKLTSLGSSSYSHLETVYGYTEQEALARFVVELKKWEIEHGRKT